jgi:hypothetical protein
MIFTAVTFYTNDYYRQQIKILSNSCKKFEIPLIITEVEDKGSWVKNCAFKAYYLYEMLHTTSTNIVWLDADSCIMKYPELFGSIKEDFAIRAEPGLRTKKPVGREVISLPENWPKDIDPCWFNSGTIFLKNNDKTKELCRRWLQLSTTNVSDWDQWTLQQAWCDVQPSTYWLPKEYCQIKKLHGEQGSVILHELASVTQKVSRI